MREDATRGGISFELTDEQRDLQALAHEFAERELRPIARERDEREDYPPGLLAKAASAGLTSYSIPAEYGGGGVGSVTAALIAEELSWGCAGLASTIQATMFPVRPLVRYGTDEQRERYLPLLAREEGTLGAIAFTEAHAGSDLASIRATARPDGEGGGWILDGEKVYVTNGGIADLTVVFAQAEEGITAFLVEVADPGVSAGRKERKLGLRASYTGSLVLDAARVPPGRVLGKPGEGFLVAMDFFEVSRPQVAAAAVGVARAAFEHAVEDAREREAFGRPILHPQGVSFKLADMAMEIDAARVLVSRAGAAGDAGPDAGLPGSDAKALAPDPANRVATDAVPNP